MKRIYYIIGTFLLSLLSAVITYYLVENDVLGKSSDYQVLNVSYIDTNISSGKDDYKLFLAYDKYSEFCKRNKLDETLSRVDFNRNAYVMLISEYTTLGDFRVSEVDIEGSKIEVTASSGKDNTNIKGSVLYLISINKRNVNDKTSVKFIVNEEKSEVNLDEVDLSTNVQNWLKDTKSNEYIVTVLAQTWCSHCNNYKPVVEALQSEYNFKLYWFDMDELPTIDSNTIKNTYELNHYSGTPYTFVIKNGKFVSFNSGERNYEDTLNYLIASNVIDN